MLSHGDTPPPWQAKRGHQSPRHGERSAASTDSVMASAARPSIFEVRGDGLPRYARSDGNVSWQAKRVHHWLCHGEQSAAIKDPVMASAARPSILDVRGDGLPHFARSDGIFDLLFTVCVQFRVGFRKLALARSQTWPRPLAYPRA